MVKKKDFVINWGRLIEYTGDGGDIIIPDGVKEIGWAFKKCTSLTGVTIPGSVKKIGWSAFEGCSNLKNVSILDGSLEEIGVEAFKKCTSLTDVTIPGSVKKIDERAFSGCSNLKNVSILDGSLEEIGKEAFKRCKSLSSISLPGNMEAINISTYAFDGCDLLKDKHGLIVFGSVLFRCYPKTRKITIPENVSIIHEYAFYRCDKLKEITIPDSVKEIGDYAFAWCSGLTSISIPDSVKEIGDYAFAGCSGLTSISITDNVQIIGRSLFLSCENLSYIKVNHWFKDITKLIDDDSVDNVDQVVIETQDDLMSIPSKYRISAAIGFAMNPNEDMDSEKSKTYKEFLKKKSSQICSRVINDEKVMAFLCSNDLIPSDCFDLYMAEANKTKNTALKAMLLDYQNKNSVEITKARKKTEKRKEDYADAQFERMVNRDLKKSIKDVVFVITGRLSPVWQSREEVQKYLESYGAILGKTISKKTDYLVTNDTESGSEKNRKALSLGVSVISEDDFNDMIGKRYKDAEEIVVPEWIREIPAKAFSCRLNIKRVSIPNGVKRIGERAFEDCRNLETLFIPDSVHNIEPDAFLRCVELLSVIIPNGISVIRNGVFASCRKLKNVTIPDSVKKIESRAFQDCRSLTSVSIPDSVEKIESRAFQDCRSLTSVRIPDSVEEIEELTFSWCSSLKSVSIPGSVKKIIINAFYECDLLEDKNGLIILGDFLYRCNSQNENIIIPEGVSIINDYAFLNCKNLISISIPESVIEIGYGAFIGCTNLTNLSIPNSVREIGSWAFYGCDSLNNLEIPKTVVKIGEHSLPEHLSNQG